MESVHFEDEIVTYDRIDLSHFNVQCMKLVILWKVQTFFALILASMTWLRCMQSYKQ